MKLEEEQILEIIIIIHFEFHFVSILNVKDQDTQNQFVPRFYR